MKNQEILTKAIQKAIDGGWKGWGYRPTSNDLMRWRWEDDDRVFSDGEYDDYETINVEAIIFRHDFAKALWGEKETYIEAVGLVNTTVTPRYLNDWQYHLQQMVIAEDPIKYLGDHI